MPLAVVACAHVDSTYMSVSPVAARHLFGVALTYSCILGYNHTTGDLTRTCQSSGQWSGTLPACASK